MKATARLIRSDPDGCAWPSMMALLYYRIGHYDSIKSPRQAASGLSLDHRPNNARLHEVVT